MNFGIIAAGEGSRLVSEGVSLPKPLVKIDNKPMIGRLINIFENLEAGRISVIINEYMTEVGDYLRSLAPHLKCDLDIVVKTTPSSMHSFYQLGSLLKGEGRFVLTTVDTIFRKEDFRKYVEAFADAPSTVDGMMAVTTHIDDEKPLYVETDRNMDILAFRDSAWTDARYISGGIYGLDSNAIDVLDDCLRSYVSRMRNFQRALVKAGLHLKAFDMGKILDVDHAGDITKANEFINSPEPDVSSRSSK